MCGDSEVLYKVEQEKEKKYSMIFVLNASLNKISAHTWPNGWLGVDSQFQRKLMYGTLVWGARSMLKPRNSWVTVVTQEK